MDELAKTEARNYLTAAGFFLIVAYYMLLVFLDTGAELSPEFRLATGFGLLLVGTLLIVLRKRDMIALLFVMLSFYFLSNGFIPEFVGATITLCFNGLIVLTLLVTLTGKDKAKWLIVVLPLLMFVTSLIDVLSGTRPVVFPLVTVLFVIISVISVYFALACASERLHLPGRKLLTADEETDFKASGSVLGYLLFAVLSGAYAVYYIVGESMMHLEYLHTINLVAAVLMIFVAVLLLTVGKMRFTPVMFLLIGLADLLTMFSSGAMFIGTGILFIIIGLFAMLRKESRILPGIMLILYSAVFFIMCGTGYGLPEIAIGILEIVVAAISVYLAFAVYSQKKLPMF